MDFSQLYKTLEAGKYYIFSFEDLLTFFPDEKRANLKKAVFRWKEKKWLYSLKKGVYELTYPRDFNIADMRIANFLYSPSYISLETALSNYSIIPEVSMAVTSITTKPTRKFRNKHGLFVYHTVHPRAFTGYYVQKYEGFDVRIAEPEKALIDFIYFKTYRNKKADLTQERLDRRLIARLNKKKLSQYAKIFNLNIKELHAYL